MIPGIASTYRIYALLLNRLAERFRTIVYDYPGDHPDDGARLSRITHDHLVDDLFGLIDHLNIGRVFLLGISFGSTIALKALAPRAEAVPEGGRAGRVRAVAISPAERWALRLGRLVPGTVARLPLRRTILTYNSRVGVPGAAGRPLGLYLEQNGLTPIRSLAHRVALLTDLDLRPILPEIPTEVLLIQGNEDRIVPRRDYETLQGGPPAGRRGHHADRRPPAAPHACRSPGATDRRLAPAVRPRAREDAPAHGQLDSVRRRPEPA